MFWEGHKILRNLHRRFDCYYIGQIYGGDFAKFCGLLRIYELYNRRILTKKNSKDEDGRNTWAFLRNLGDKRPRNVINLFGYDEVWIFNICFDLIYNLFFNYSNLKQILAKMSELGWGRLCPPSFLLGPRPPANFQT